MAVREDRDTKAELNRRSQACDVLADTGIRVAEMVGHEGPQIAKRSSIIWASDSWRNWEFNRALYFGLEDRRVSLNTYARKWSPVRELHPAERFCRPLPELLGQRDRFSRAPLARQSPGGFFR
jgi:hypothetical protein